MESVLVRRILTALAVLAAVVLGWNLANGDYLLIGICGVLALLLVSHWVTRLPPDLFFGGLIIFGYLVGNRGFAQMQLPGLPLLPAEAVLGLGLALSIWRSARTKTLLLKRDPLNFAIAAWVVVGLARLPYDVRMYGFYAARDFASIYYALFFFLAQEWHESARGSAWLSVCLTTGLALLTPIFAAFTRWPATFLSFTIAGVPPIYVKGDVAGGFMAAGVFWFGWRFVQQRLWPWLVLTAVCAAGAVLCNSRASLLALSLGAIGLLVLRERRVFRVLLLIAGCGALLLAGEFLLPRDPGQSSQAFRIYESLRSIADVSGQETPVNADLGDKPDNNRFRLVWWQAVVNETRDNGLWLGLGFGHDLADQFVRTYYADSDEEFSTRSPHNFLITVFARMGIVGLSLFLVIVAIMAKRTWRAAMAEPDSGASAPWLFSWMILITACFGVVMEGPMGAVLFWTLLGLANAALRESTLKIELAEGAALQPAEQAGELAAAP